jgi:hypothetical protein
MSIKFHHNLRCNKKALGYHHIGNKRFIWFGPLFIEVTTE